MIAGHYATALIAHQKFPKGTLLFFLLASQFQDVLWFVFHYLGLEPTTPTDVFDATISTLSAHKLTSLISTSPFRAGSDRLTSHQLLC